METFEITSGICFSDYFKHNEREERNIFMNFGIVTDCYGVVLSLEDSIRRLNKLGFHDLEIPGWHWNAGEKASSGTGRKAERIKEVCKLLNDCAMRVHQYHSAHALSAASESLRMEQVNRIKETIDLASELSAAVLVLHIGGRHDMCANVTDQAIFDANAKSLAELAQHAKNTPVKIAIENLMSDVYRQGCRISELKDLIREVNSEKIGICLDTGHANVDGLDVPEAIRECGSLLIATHIQETCPGNDLHALPFSLRRVKSTMNWFDIFRTFRETQYPFPLIGECANNTGELPFDLVDRYLEPQRLLIQDAVDGKFDK